MRLDNYLKTSRLIRKRSLAKELCKQGAVAINGLEAKAGKEVKEGDRIVIDLWNVMMEVEVMRLPAGNVSRSEARELYRLLTERKKNRQMEW